MYNKILPHFINHETKNTKTNLTNIEMESLSFSLLYDISYIDIIEYFSCY